MAYKKLIHPSFSSRPLWQNSKMAAAYTSSLSKRGRWNVKRLFVGLQERTTTTIYSNNWSHVVLFPRKNALCYSLFVQLQKNKRNQKYSVNSTNVVLYDPWKKYRQHVLGLKLHLHLLLGSSSNKRRQESNSCWRTELCTAVNSALRKNANKRMFKDFAMRSLERYWSIVIALTLRH